MKKILVTGGAGNIGSSLVKSLLKTERYHVSIVDNLSTGSKANLPQANESHWEFINCDVNTLDQLKKVFEKNSFHYIFHYAALVGVERTQKNPLKVLEDIEGIKNILNLAVEFNAERIFYSSSSEVYGEPVEIPQNEITTPLNSKLPYAIVKSVGESFMRTFHEHHQLDFTIMRFFNTYGPRQKNDFVISKFIELALQNKDITIYGDGSQTRSFLHVDDNVEFTINILEKKKLLNEVVNVGSDIEITIIDLANLIIKILKSQSNIIFLPPLKEGDMTRRKPDTSKMKEVYGKEIISLEEGIQAVASASSFEELLMQDVSIIIPTFHFADVAKQVLLSALQQTLSPKEIIIIDSSEDHSIRDLVSALESEIPINYQKVAQSFPGEARNLGVTFANYEWLAFLDSKTIPKSDWLESNFETLEANNA